MSPHLHLADAGRPVEMAAQAASPIKVLLADDHAVIRRNLRLLLDGEADLEVIAEAASLPEVDVGVQRGAPHVLVLGLQLPDGSSLQALRQLRKLIPDAGIVVMTMEESPIFAHQALDAGAVAFVLKDRADTELPAAVRAAARGREYVSPRLAAALRGTRTAVQRDRLSSRETEILRLIALGYTSAEIGRDLNLSRRTVETHRANIFRKLALRTRAELVAYALRGQLIGS